MFKESVSLLTEQCIELEQEINLLLDTDKEVSFKRILYLKDMVHEHKQAIDVLKNYKY